MAAIKTLLNAKAQDAPPDLVREVRQGQMTEFLGTLRCAACVRGDHKCWIRESDEECLLCTSTHEPCIFTRTVTKRGTKAAFAWNDLIASEPLPQRDNSSYPFLSLHQSNRPVSDRSDKERYGRGRQTNGSFIPDQSPLNNIRDHGPKLEARSLPREIPNDVQAHPQSQPTSIPESGPVSFFTTRRAIDNSLAPITPQLIARKLDINRGQHIHPASSPDAERRRTTEVPFSPGFRHERQDPSDDSPRHKRARMDLDRRAEVSMVRSLGACLRCRLMKVPCSSSRPCNECHKVAVAHNDTRLPKLSHLPCISGHLKSLLPSLFGGATTGILSTDKFEGLSKPGLTFFDSLSAHRNDDLSSLALQCYNRQSSTIHLEKVHELLDKLDEVYIRHRLKSTPQDLTSAVLSICAIMTMRRAFAGRYMHSSGSIHVTQRDLILQSGVSVVGSLFVVAATAMTEDESFNAIAQCAGLVDDCKDEVTKGLLQHATTQTLYERVEGLLFTSRSESSEFKQMSISNTALVGDGVEAHDGHSHSELDARQVKISPGAPKRVSIQDAINNDSIPDTVATDHRDWDGEKPHIQNLRQIPAYSNGSLTINPVDNLRCKHCDHQANTTSEAKKHKLRHEKPFKCSIPGCSRTEGFTTQNDLDRHQRAIHAVARPGIIGYRCVAENCLKKDKVWPRADNFRQHCLRLHANVDTAELMRKSLLSEQVTVPNVRPLEGHDTDVKGSTSISSPGTAHSDVLRTTNPPTISATADFRAGEPGAEASEQPSPVANVGSPRSTAQASEDHKISNTQSVPDHDGPHSKGETTTSLQNSPKAPSSPRIIASPQHHQEAASTTSLKSENHKTDQPAAAEDTPVATPPSFKFPRIRNGLEPATMTYYVYETCTDPSSHIAGKRLEGNPKLNGSKGPPERFVVTPGTCPHC